MDKIEKVYDHSPIFLQNLMISVKGKLNEKERYGKAYYKELAFLREFDTWPFEKQLKYQNLSLRKFLKYTVENSEFYRMLYKEIDVSCIRCIEDLKQLPIIDKETLRENINKIITIPKANAVEGHTGGTTGKSLVVLFTKEDMMKRMAMLDHFKERVGFKNLEMKRATFNGKHIVPASQKKKTFWRFNKPANQMIYSSFHITEDNCKYYIESLNHFKPQAIDGFFTSICDIANYIERHGIRLNFKPVAIFPTSETLTERGRMLLERVFQTKVYDQYASSEGAPFITECPHQHLHLEMASGVFEHFENSNNEVLVTSFTTHGTPLIRYRIGDSVEFYDKSTQCNCGLHMPLVNSIEGRNLDFLYTVDGAKINAGNIANLFKNMPNALIRSQLIQENMDAITILLEVDKEKYKPEFDALLKEEFEHKFGENMKLIIKHVDKIPREKSGKYRMIKNRIRN